MKTLLAITTFLIATSSFAGLLVEPQLGYAVSNTFKGTYTITGVGNANTDVKSHGFEYGGRLGYQMLGVMGGLNYNHMSGTSTNNTNGTKSDVSGNDMGAFIGFNAPILLRGWFGYNFSSKVDVGTSKYKGTSTEFGLGFTGLPFLSLNLIYKMYDYTKLTSSGTEYTVSGFKPKEFALAVSAPFNLF